MLVVMFFTLVVIIMFFTLVVIVVVFPVTFLIMIGVLTVKRNTVGVADILVRRPLKIPTHLF